MGKISFFSIGTNTLIKIVLTIYNDCVKIRKEKRFDRRNFWKKFVMAMNEWKNSRFDRQNLKNFGWRWTSEARERKKKMEKIRGFEVAKGFEDKEINLPIRKTKYSAGYDIEAAEDVTIPSFKKGMAPTLIKTGIKLIVESRA